MIGIQFFLPATLCIPLVGNQRLQLLCIVDN
jgi:hypothetical protein